MLLSAVLTAAPPAYAQIEGYGKDATGGAGRPVCTVTSSAASGAGSFATCVDNGGNQIIQFAVSTVAVSGTNYVGSNTTIDGCANGQNGVTLNMPADGDRSVIIEGPVSNVIVRCMRFQGSGPKRPGFNTENDLLGLDGTSGLITQGGRRPLHVRGLDGRRPRHHRQRLGRDRELEPVLRHGPEPAHQVRHPAADQPPPQRLHRPTASAIPRSRGTLETSTSSATRSTT